MKRKLENEPSLYKEYDEVIKSYLKEGIIEPVPANNEKIAGKVHYLLHRAVVREDRDTTKVRIVFDASSKSGDNPALNDCLYTGPSMILKRPSILSRFRFGNVGIVADIKQAFLNVQVEESYRDLLRFLWFTDYTDPDSEIIVYRFTRLVIGLTSSPYSLAATIYKHLQTLIELNIDTDILNKFLADLYVDDEATSLNTTEEGYEFYIRTKEHLATAGLNLRKWDTNDKALKRLINAHELNESNDSSFIGVWS